MKKDIFPAKSMIHPWVFNRVSAGHSAESSFHFIGSKQRGVYVQMAPLPVISHSHSQQPGQPGDGTGAGRILPWEHGSSGRASVEGAAAAHLGHSTSPARPTLGTALKT